MMKIMLLLLSLNFWMVQGPALHRWICKDYQVKIGNELHHPQVILEILVSKRMVTGRLKLVENGKVIRISELVGSVYSDGSVSLAERWVDQTDSGWLPNYNAILITDINAKSFRLNFNSATSGKAIEEKGAMHFLRSAISPMS